MSRKPRARIGQLVDECEQRSMKSFNSISDGLSATRQLATQKRKVGALLTFQGKDKKPIERCFLFESVEDPIAQLIKANPNNDIFDLSNADRDEKGALLGARNAALSSVVAVLPKEDLGITQHGHAEEFLIRDFEAACQQVGEIGKVNIYLTHSPCTRNDTNPSYSLRGWPRSCTAKLGELAERNRDLQFVVFYWQHFGSINRATSDAELRMLSGPQVNLGFGKMDP